MASFADLGEAAKTREVGRDSVLVAEEEESRVRMLGPRYLGPLDDHLRGMVTPHGIQSDIQGRRHGETRGYACSRR